MGSRVDAIHGLRAETPTTPMLDGIAPKTEPLNLGGSCSSSVSTPEPDGEIPPPDQVQRQKRKGGRKPIYATSEERKQRNRQAQAAFRERRSEYIKQLEATIKLNEESLRTLQQSHRSAADECLMLRYKNSLLERILLEKGIDVQSELRLKSGSPGLPPTRLPTHQPHRPSPLSQPALSRQVKQQSQAAMTPRLSQTSISHREGVYKAHSPQAQQPTPASLVSPPPASSLSPGYNLPGGMSPASVEMHSQTQQKSQYHQSSIGNFCHGTPGSTPASVDTSDTPAASYSSGTPLGHRLHSPYSLTPFSKQYESMDTDYPPHSMAQDAPDHEGRTPSSNAYSHDYSTPRGITGVGESENYGSITSYTEHYDPMLDADPFGLSASMHFQTPFSYSQSNSR